MQPRRRQERLLIRKSRSTSNTSEYYDVIGRLTSFGGHAKPWVQTQSCSFHPRLIFSTQTYHIEHLAFVSSHHFLVWLNGFLKPYPQRCQDYVNFHRQSVLLNVLVASGWKHQHCWHNCQQPQCVVAGMWRWWCDRTLLGWSRWVIFGVIGLLLVVTTDKSGGERIRVLWFVKPYVRISAAHFVSRRWQSLWLSTPPNC